MKKVVFPILLLILVLLAGEVLVSVAFWWKDRPLVSENVTDYPYLYFLFSEDDSLSDLGLKFWPEDYPGDEFQNQSSFNILLLGGSVVRMGSREENLAAQLQTKLRDKTGISQINVLNAGVSAYVVQQQFLLYQMFLQRYKPDMVLTLDGYNDLYSFWLNRHEQAVFPLLPHQWKEWKGLEKSRKGKGISGRLRGIFPGYLRLMDYFEREIKDSKLNWSQLPGWKTLEFTSAFRKVSNDLQTLCEARGTVFFEFLQPVRFVGTGAVPADPAKEALAQLYSALEDTLVREDYVFSLLYIMDAYRGEYLDDCHFTPAGTAILAEAMANRLLDTLEVLLSEKGLSNALFILPESEP